MDKNEIKKRINAIENGADFGEIDFGDAFANAYFKYKLIEVVDREKGIIKVMDISQRLKPVFNTDVCGLYIHGIDKLTFED